MARCLTCLIRAAQQVAGPMHLRHPVVSISIGVPVCEPGVQVISSLKNRMERNMWQLNAEQGGQGPPPSRGVLISGALEFNGVFRPRKSALDAR
jgi:hypothetical protein